MQDLIDQIKKKKAKKVLVQVPEGLKMKAINLAEDLRREGIEAFLSADPCYGACDLRDVDAKRMGCDLLVHIGHNKFYIDFKTAVPVLYYPYEIKLDSQELEKTDFSQIKENNIGLVSTVQHTSSLDEIVNILEKSGKKAFIGGQILGCWSTNAQKIEKKVDAFLYIGSGKFHPEGMKTKKPIYTLDVETKKIEKIDFDLMEKRRFAKIYKAKDAKSFAILVSVKGGQKELIGNAERIKKKLEAKDKKAYIVVMDEISENKLLGLKVDAYVNTACPRIAEDHFSKPMLNPEDLQYVLEE